MKPRLLSVRMSGASACPLVPARCLWGAKTLASRSDLGPKRRHGCGGDLGAGKRWKLVNNTWLAFASEAVATSMALAHRLALGTDVVVAALDGSPLFSPWQHAKLQRIADDDFSAQFALSRALKDVHLALQAADHARFVALVGLAREWEQAVADGLGDRDLTVVTRALESQAARP